jgi:hypothetical protein
VRGGIKTPGLGADVLIEPRYPARSTLFLSSAFFFSEFLYLCVDQAHGKARASLRAREATTLEEQPHPSSHQQRSPKLTSSLVRHNHKKLVIFSVRCLLPTYWHLRLFSHTPSHVGKSALVRLLRPPHFVISGKRREVLSNRIVNNLFDAGLHPSSI